MAQPPYQHDPRQPYGQQPPPGVHQPQYGPPQGPPPPWQTGPYGQQPPPPPKRGKSPLFWIFAVGLPLVLLVGCIATIASVDTGTGSETGTTRRPAAQRPTNIQTQPDQAPPAEESTSQGDEPAHIGDTVRDGQFAFKVTKLQKASRVGGEYLNKDAQGEFLIVHVTVKNEGDKAGHFFGDAQKILDGDGKEYSADSGAAIYFKNAKSLYEEINPGNQVNGVVLFDLPKVVEPKAIVLHDSLFSEGVTVNLAS